MQACCHRKLKVISCQRRQETNILLDRHFVNRDDRHLGCTVCHLICWRDHAVYNLALNLFSFVVALLSRVAFLTGARIGMH